MVSSDEVGLTSSAEACKSRWKGFLVNSSARGDMSASKSSMACWGASGLFASFDSISDCSFDSCFCSFRLGDENRVRIDFAGVARNSFVRGVSGLDGDETWLVACAGVEAMVFASGDVLRLSMWDSIFSLRLGGCACIGAGTCSNVCVDGVRACPSSEAKPLNV